MSTQEDIDMFQELFFHEVESWFTADIVCCDECCDEFLSLWPHADLADDAAFQRSSIDLDSFYSGSMLQDVYTKDQFNELVKHIHCPRCWAQLKGNIWPYTFPFVVASDTEKAIQEIGSLAEQTPFLLLTHEFSKKVYETVCALGSTLQPMSLSQSLYRARLKDPTVTESPYYFDMPPRDIVQEGRYNHTGSPVLYLSSDPDTCYEEKGRQACIIAEIQINKPLKILDLIDPFNAHRQFGDILASLVYSALMSAKAPDKGWHKPQYVFSRFVSDCARGAGIQAIKYPSTRITKTNFNLVIVNAEFSLKKCGKVVRYIHMDEETK